MTPSRRERIHTGGGQAMEDYNRLYVAAQQALKALKTMELARMVPMGSGRLPALQKADHLAQVAIADLEAQGVELP